MKLSLTLISLLAAPMAAQPPPKGEIDWLPIPVVLGSDAPSMVPSDVPSDMPSDMPSAAPAASVISWGDWEPAPVPAPETAGGHGGGGGADDVSPIEWDSAPVSNTDKAEPKANPIIWETRRKKQRKLRGL